ncbi:hypothetical protein E6C67_02810 (plasmid) [Azospirillum sp. TSA2s]|uniref:tyrosine-type recombinase/integrase n=1 Tax=Azospirillum sp. TSA2s TaxID=709810 RepID=UPI0010A9EBBC|nr:tyrosine-type recombinase/integrase [Azospirillum sp. TSA2s]QCG92900.1 hypothetical protein E6C67_02810 [Azospirillum sp. TSA2s]
MTTGPDTLLPVALDPALPSADLVALVAEAHAFVQRAKADKTRTTYRTAWRRYQSWCGEHGIDPLSPDPRQLVLFVTELARALKTASIRTYLSGVAHHLRQEGVPVDLQHKAIVEVLAGVARTKGIRPTKVAPLLPEVMRPVLAALPASPLGARDASLLLTGLHGALRRSEISALDLADVEIQSRGVLVTLRRSKTDQAGRGAVVPLVAAREAAVCPRAALLRWLELRGDDPGPLYVQATRIGDLRDGLHRLSDRAVARIVQSALTRAGRDATGYAGHSLRRGLATAAAQKQHTLAAIMKQTRHKSADMALSYVADVELWTSVSDGLFD